MLTATCHCGAVRVEIRRRARSVTNCNCSICRRYRTLWAHYKGSQVRASATPGAIGEYDPDLLGPVRIRRLDGASTWRNLD